MRETMKYTKTKHEECTKTQKYERETQKHERETMKAMKHTYMKNIGVLRDTARAPKPILQKHAIPCNGVIRYHKIPYHT